MTRKESEEVLALYAGVKRILNSRDKEGNLETGDNLDEFLAQYPAVSYEQAVQAIELATEKLTTDTRHEVTPY